MRWEVPKIADPLVSVAELIRAALATDGEHHKQWLIEQIAAHLGIEVDRDGYRP